MLFNLLLNIGLLVLIATMLTNLPPVRALLLEEKQTFRSRLWLSLIFGMVSICSTYIGVPIQGAIVNTRVIGVMAAGLLGGPYVGVGAALIGGIHRYLFDIGGFTAVSCALSTIMEGAIGAAFSRKFKAGEIGGGELFLLTAVAEMGQMAIILLVARPYSAAIALVEKISLPMILMNSFGMMVFIGVFNRIFLVEESLYGEKMRIALAIAEKSLPHLRNGLHSREDMAEAVRIIHRSTDCEAVMITDAKEVLAKVGGGGEFEALEHCPLIAPIPDSIRTGNALMEIYTAQGDQRELFCPALEGNVVIAAPLVEQDKVVGSLAIIVKKRWHGYKPHLIIVTELARLFSTQLELSDLDYQRRLRKRAELRALQNQVNPHFLYNILNTISSVCRENPDRARELLLTLSLYYRQTLENEQYMIRLSTELYQVMNYLKLEQARFEEKLAVEFDIEEELDCVLPSFILQPLVENAVRYGVDKRGFRIINISAETKEDAAVIAVTDHGSGIPDEVVRSLKAGQGKGVGLLNVHKRLQSLSGEEGGLQITVTENGSRVAFRIPLGKIEDLGEPAAISAQGRAV